MSFEPLRYNTATAAGTHVTFTMVKAGSDDLATNADWTPVSGDCSISLDGATAVNTTNLPAFNGNSWTLALTAAETTAKTISIRIVDAATKVVQDNHLVRHTAGHASAYYLFDFFTASTPQTGDSFARIGSNGAGLTALGDTRLANLDAAISTRSTYAGGAVASVTGNVGGSVASVTGSVGSVTGSVASVTGAVGSVTAPVTIVTTTVIPTTGNTPNSIADCLNASRAQGFGDWDVSDDRTELDMLAPNGTTVVHTHQFDKALPTSAILSRTSS